MRDWYDEPNDDEPNDDEPNTTSRLTPIAPITPFSLYGAELAVIGCYVNPWLWPLVPLVILAYLMRR